jgi:hypothetical protein
MSDSSTEQPLISLAYDAVLHCDPVELSTDLLLLPRGDCVLESCARVFLAPLRPDITKELDKLDSVVAHARPDTPIVVADADPAMNIPSAPGYYDPPSPDFILSMSRRAALRAQVCTLAERALTNLILSQLIPLCEARNNGAELTLRTTPQNPTSLYLVDGLTCNDFALVPISLTVTADQVADALRTAYYQGAPVLPTPKPRPSALVEGLRSLIGRRVEVHIGHDPDLFPVGVLRAACDTHLTLFDSEEVTVIPLSAVLAVSSFQLTAEEALLLLP